MKPGLRFITGWRAAETVPPTRALDVLVSAAGLVLTAPLLLVVAIVSWLRDGVSPVVGVPTVGRHEEPFLRWQLRVAEPGIERLCWGRDERLPDDQVTPLGHWLLRWHLFWLPTLWNVLRGEMALVGPTPHHPLKASQQRLRLPHYAQRFAMAPGLVSPALAAPSGCSSDAHLGYELLYTRGCSVGAALWLLMWSARLRWMGNR